MAKSTDGGRHWSGPTVVSTGGPNVQSYNHAIEVTANGTVVLTYYDDRNNVLGDGDRHHRHLAAPLARRHGAPGSPSSTCTGRSTTTRRRSRSSRPAIPRGLFLGDYMGLETIANDNVITFFTSTISDGADVHSIRANHP